MILDEIVKAKEKRLRDQKYRISDEEMRLQAEQVSRTLVSFRQALSKEGLSIIGEFKKASPSMGVIHNQLDLTERIAQYNESVDAISCLTEQDYFNGSADYLKEIRSISPLPILRKDFIINAYQIDEAKVIGADAILLIAAILDDERLRKYYERAKELGLDVLLEVHDEREMERALDCGADIIGVNNRNLKDFTISLETTGRLSKMVPDHIVFVSESGVSEEEDILYLKECRVNALLIGRAFMESVEPKALAARWKTIFGV